jgi:hypothetical protein
MKEDEVGGTCGTHWGGERCSQGFGGGDLDIDGGVTLKMDLRKIEIDGTNWIRLGQDRVQWRGVVKTVMNLRVA